MYGIFPIPEIQDIISEERRIKAEAAVPNPFNVTLPVPQDVEKAPSVHLTDMFGKAKEKPAAQ